MNKDTVRRLLLVPCIIAVGGFFYNFATGFNGVVIIPHFFPNGEDVHLGTLLIWIGIGSTPIFFLLSRIAKPSKIHFSKEVETAFEEQHSKKTLPKGFIDKTSKEESKK